MGFWNSNKKTYFQYFEDQAKEALTASELLVELFLEGSDKQRIVKLLHACEERGDHITHTVLQQMNKSGFILPIDHDEIFMFTKAIDDVIDRIDDAAESFVEIYELAEGTSYAREFAELILESAKLLLENCPLLSKPSYHAAKVLENCIKIHQLENAADDLKKETLKMAYRELKEGKADTAKYLAWSDIYNTLEIVTDKIEDCANICEQIVTKYA